MQKYRMPEPPNPLISFEQFRENLHFFCQKGVLGFFNYVEVTEIVMFGGRETPPVNVFSLIVFEEHKSSPSTEPVFLNTSKRITIPMKKKCSFGIYRYFCTVENFERYLQSFQEGHEWLLSGSKLSISKLTPLPPQFVPADHTDMAPLNCLLKNNFWNGSYVLELFDNTKPQLRSFFASPDALQALSNKVNEYVPLKLASLSDRLGNIVIQIPSKIGAFELSGDKNDKNGYTFSWREGVKKRKTHLIAFSEIDKNIIAFESLLPPKEMSWTLPIGKAPKIDRTYLYDSKNKILLAASSPLAFIREINLGISPINSEPRAIYIPRSNGTQEKTHISISSSMPPSKIGHPDIFAYKKWIQKRIYNAEKEALSKNREFVQYGLVADKQAEHIRALEDIRFLLQRNGRISAWLWDPFLSAHDVMETLFFTPYFGSNLRALTSGSMHISQDSPSCEKAKTVRNLERWKSEQAAVLNTPGNNYLGIKLAFKISYGPNSTAFHDRFLIFPDTDNGPVAWSLGTSVNSLGMSHHILQKVAHPRLVADAFQSIWETLDGDKYLIWERP